jgi:hypothetical protein
VSSPNAEHVRRKSSRADVLRGVESLFEPLVCLRSCGRLDEEVPRRSDEKGRPICTPLVQRIKRSVCQFANIPCNTMGRLIAVCQPKPLISLECGASLRGAKLIKDLALSLLVLPNGCPISALSLGKLLGTVERPWTRTEDGRSCSPE